MSRQQELADFDFGRTCVQYFVLLLRSWLWIIRQSAGSACTILYVHWWCECGSLFKSHPLNKKYIHPTTSTTEHFGILEWIPLRKAVERHQRFDSFWLRFGGWTWCCVPAALAFLLRLPSQWTFRWGLRVHHANWGSRQCLLEGLSTEKH